MTSRLARDRINDQRMKSKQGELKKNTRKTKLKSKKEDWRPNVHGKEVHSQPFTGLNCKLTKEGHRPLPALNEHHLIREEGRWR